MNCFNFLGKGLINKWEKHSIVKISETNYRKKTNEVAFTVTDRQELNFIPTYRRACPNLTPFFNFFVLFAGLIIAVFKVYVLLPLTTSNAVFDA